MISASNALSILLRSSKPMLLLLVITGNSAVYANEYCEASANRPWNAWISGVNFAGIDHQENKKDRYRYIDIETGSLTTDASHELTVTTTLSWIREVLHYKVWIDYNQDGIFDGTTETAAYVINPETVNGAPQDIANAEITIPSDAVIGRTRMRISMAWNEEPTPCDTHESGEVNDFNVVIAAGDGTAVANQTPTANIVVSGVTGNVPLDVAFDGSTSSDADGEVVSYVWDFGDGSDASGETTEHTYINAGIYTAFLTATDNLGATATKGIKITVNSANENLAPIASISQSLNNGTAPLQIEFDASGSSDEDGTIVNYVWDFGDGSDAENTSQSHVYTAAGNYTVTLTVTDNAGVSDTATTTIEVIDDSSPIQEIALSLRGGNDDAEEKEKGETNVSSSDLELVEEGQLQLVGLRFADVPVGANATIVSAWIQFTADESDAGDTALIIHGEKTGNAFPYETEDFFISSRSRTEASIDWQPAAWAKDEQSNAQKTPDLTDIIQEIVNQNDWQAFNGLGLMVSGTGKRVAVSRNQSSAKSAVLHIRYRGGITSEENRLTRSPYLQTLTEAGVIIRWNTRNATDSSVRYGENSNNLDQFASPSGDRTEHIVQLKNLKPDTRYFYQLESGGEIISSDQHYFETAPVVGNTDAMRIWVIGDAGRANFAQESVFSAYQEFTKDQHTDVWLMLGDNAYEDGTEVEYQEAVFDMYGDLLDQTALWPTYGNHDAHSASANNETGPFYELFSLPTDGEAGGTASGTEAYYSFDYGNVHFICLNSTPNGDTFDAQFKSWLAQDLSENDQTWTIAYMHHPPYSKGSHDSDTSSALGKLREGVVPMLEDAGVDMLLTGHSHSYERSFLIDGHYGKSTTFDASMLVDAGDGDPNGDGAYQKPVDQQANSGTVYAVVGASGSLTNAPLGHPIMAYDEVRLGSMVIDVEGNELKALYLDHLGNVRDEFSIIKSD